MPFVDLSSSSPQPLSQPQPQQATDPAAVVQPVSEPTVPAQPMVAATPVEGHELMSEAPTGEVPGVVVQENGVKEMAGPPVAPPPIAPQPDPVAAPVPAPTPLANTVDLTGSAVNEAQKVQDILQKADTLITEKAVQQAVPAAAVTNESTPAGKPIELRTTTADEKFMAEKASIAELLSLAEKHNASDLHLSVGYPPILRVDGDLMNLGGQPVSEERIKELFSQILSKQQNEFLQKYLDVDFSYTHSTGTRFRVNIYRKSDSLAGAFRLIPSRIRTVAELGLPEVFYDLVKIPQGLVILAGPTGSGKSTTIASMIQEINMNQPRHIITLEDPIEYIFPKGKAMINQREIGTDALTFKRALREVLREDPDVVLVGEMRDFETIAATITTAETGHLVFSTLHTNSASQTVDRMIDVFPEAQQAQIRAQLANVISAVISQRLIPIKGGGRKAALEIMVATPAIRNAIREAKTYQIDNMIQTNSELGMVTLEKSLIEMIRKGEITLETAQEFTTKPEELISLMKTN